MRKILIAASATLMTAALFAGPISPVSASAWNGGKGLDEKIAQLDQQVKDAEGRSAINSDKASVLNGAVASLQRMHSNFAKGGISPEEQSTLEHRIEKVQEQINRDVGA